MYRHTQIHDQFSRTGGLTRVKLIEYIPILIVTNLSTLLLVTVDGLVVGNLRGADALASVSMTAPVEFLINSLSIIIASGSAMCLSTALGRNDQKGVLNIKKAIFMTMIVGAMISAIVQIPVAYMMIRSFNMVPSVETMAWQYAIGLMIGAPFGMISTVGVYQLQGAGKMKILVWLSVMEGILNLLLDLLFVGTLDLGVGGAGLGTACSTLIRCVVTLIYIHKKTEVFRWGAARVHRKDVLDILRYGFPDMANMALMTAREYILVALIVHEMSTDGAVIYGVAGFCFSLSNLFMSGIQGSARPLLGLLIGAEDWHGLRILMRQCIRLMIIFLTIIILFFEIAPEQIYHLYGQTEIPEDGLLGIRINSLYFMFYGLNTLARVYFANRKDTAFTTGVTILSNVAKPILAYALASLFPPIWILLCFLLSELLIAPLNLWRYFHWLRRDEKAWDDDGQVISMSVEPGHAAEVSRRIRAFAAENGFSERIAYHIAFCLEDMVAFAEESHKKRPIIDELKIEIIVWFRQNEGRFLMIDNGECLELETVEADSDVWRLLESKYSIAKKLATSVEYQYVLDLNYSMFRFEQQP